jgi:hypothetical protein
MAVISRTAPTQRFRDDVLAAVTALLAERQEAAPRAMFGHPGFAVGGKLFACLYDDGVALKLPAAAAQAAIVRPDVEPFRPYGKTMREWILIVHDDVGAYAGDVDLFEDAIAYVAEVASRPAPSRSRRRHQAAGA